MIRGFDIGLKDYPIYDESHREELNKKIIDKFLMREIGSETPNLFKHYLNQTMREIMPRYNKLYEIEKQKIDPNNTIKFIETEKSVANSENTGATVTNTKNASKGKNYGSNTPSGVLNDVEQGKYLTNAEFDSDEQTGESGTASSGTAKANNSVTREKAGNNENIIDVLEKLKDYAFSVDQMILNDPELEQCFMLIW